MLQTFRDIAITVESTGNEEDVRVKSNPTSNHAKWRTGGASLLNMSLDSEISIIVVLINESKFF